MLSTRRPLDPARPEEGQTHWDPLARVVHTGAYLECEEPDCVADRPPRRCDYTRPGATPWWEDQDHDRS